MSKLTLDFAPRTLRWPDGLLLGAVLVLVVPPLAACWQTRAALLALRAERAALQDAQAAYRPPAMPAKTASAASLAAAASAIQQLNTPWPALLDGLERARPPGVSVLRLAVQPARQQLLLVAQAPRWADLHAFGAKLEQQAVFSGWTPLNQTSTPDGAYQLSLQLRWQP